MIFLSFITTMSYCVNQNSEEKLSVSSDLSQPRPFGIKCYSMQTKKKGGVIERVIEMKC